MKVLQINKYFYQKGGAETVFFNTSELLMEHGHTVIPFSIKSDKNKESAYSSYFVDYPELSESGLLTKIKNIRPFIYNKKAKQQLEKLLQVEKPDIAHIHLLFNSMSVAILPVLKKYNIPVVMTVHDYRLICPAYTFRDGKGRICERCLKNHSYWQCITNKCSKGNLPNSIILSLDSYFRKYFISPVDFIDRFIFVSKFSQHKHITSNNKYTDKSTHLYNFTLIESDKSSIAKENYILYFGRISEEKGIETLIRAMEGIPNVKLKIAGTGPLLKSLSNQSNTAIDFIGFKSGDELRSLIRKALFSVVPSEWYENNPLTVIESQTLGTPVIGSNIGGIPELIKDQVDGYLFDPQSVEGLNKAIRKGLALSPADYKKMCENAQSFADTNYSKTIHYNRLISIYEDVIKKYKQ